MWIRVERESSLAASESIRHHRPYSNAGLTRVPEGGHGYFQVTDGENKS